MKQGPGVYQHHPSPEECLVNDFSTETTVSPERQSSQCGPRGRPLSESFGEFVKNVDPKPTESESLCEQNQGIWFSNKLPR